MIRRRGRRDGQPDHPAGWEPPPEPPSLFTPPDRTRAGAPPPEPPTGPPPAPPTPPGRPPADRPFARRARVPVVAGVVALVAAAGAGVTVVARHDSGPGCADRAALRVTAAPDVAPLVARVARELGDDDGCPLAAVHAQEPADTAARLARADQPRVDVWIPSSSLWLHRAAEQGGQFPASGTSVARTPLVVAVPEPLARPLGWPDATPGWADLADQVAAGHLPALRVPDPRTTTVGMLTVVAVNAETARRSPDPGIARMRALTVRSRLADAAADVEALLRQVAGASDAAAARQVGAFPTTEQRLWSYDRGRHRVPLVALYPPQGTVEADYPLAVSAAAAADPRRADLANRLTALLRAPDAARDRAAHGFRAPAGQDGPPPQAAAIAERYPPAVPPPTDPAAVYAVSTAWAGYRTRQFQVLVLVDGSGSMNGPVRDRVGRVRTKADLLREAGAQAGALFGDDTSVGLWEFSTRRPNAPYDEIVPFGPIDGRLGAVNRRTAMVAAASRFRAFPGSGTPMYETVLRATAELRRRHRPQAFSMVVLLTDGHDESSAFQMSSATFLSRLAADGDPRRPVPVFAIGYGRDADMAALRAMARATGGQAIASADPADLAESVAKVFLAVHSGR